MTEWNNNSVRSCLFSYHLQHNLYVGIMPYCAELVLVVTTQKFTISSKPTVSHTPFSFHIISKGPWPWPLRILMESAFAWHTADNPKSASVWQSVIPKLYYHGTITNSWILHPFKRKQKYWRWQLGFLICATYPI